MVGERYFIQVKNNETNTVLDLVDFGDKYFFQNTVYDPSLFFPLMDTKELVEKVEAVLPTCHLTNRENIGEATFTAYLVKQSSRGHSNKLMYESYELVHSAPVAN